ncbi:hypothetical protein [Streptomyces laurentii]|uniref:Uncharacterized protein n=1 Tax=Streptomyces laurentii TaxID=39478 RepID=A0A160P2P9_STRLU|nr:hypothetical protein SLA_3841 [Streptomyces laurentii]
MAHNPQAPYGQGGQPPEGSHDPAGSTQMFRAFVDEGVPQGQQQYQNATVHSASSGPRVGVIVGVIVAIAVLAGVAWLALG